MPIQKAYLRLRAQNKASKRRARLTSASGPNAPRHKDSSAERPKSTRGEIVVAALAFLGIAVSYILGQNQLEFARQSALSSGEDTRKALEVARRAAATAEKQSHATEVALGISKRVADASEVQAKDGNALAQTTASQLSQNVELFATQQRPVLGYDPKQFPTEGPLLVGGRMSWNYGITNFGASPAYDVVIREGLSVYGNPFQETVRTAGKILVPGARDAFSTAFYVFKPGDLVPYKHFHQILRVKLDYKDGLNRKYSSSFCWALNDDSIKVDCSSWPAMQEKRPVKMSF